MTEKMKSEWLTFDEVFSNDKHNVYYSTKPIQIFGHEFVPDDPSLESLEHRFPGTLSIEIAKEWSLEEVLPSIIEYLEWLADCRETLTTYFGEELDQELPDNWYEEIEVYKVELFFRSPDDYDASLEFGESLWPDHICMCYIEDHKIVEYGFDG